MSYAELTELPVRPDDVVAKVISPKCGAIATFFGTTRSTDGDNSVTYLNYEAYNSMALTVMKTIAKECRIQWPKVEYVAIIHRLGKVPVGEISIGIAVSSPHRADALQAVQFLIEAIKSRVPIWKKVKWDIACTFEI
ncbi:hypothetical protein CRM22_007269 [Opisthorchis felineus]|uniref:Molybdopterin synthase catalytic subunit n=1 Tax=Opisthorchis felineus TaxID=147828 RepID=A0A4S2LGP5_OPIFE|nr:hypothetical protein CRM22_007269 [Opisthorchis felineus]